MADKICKPEYLSQKAKSLTSSKLIDDPALTKNLTLWEDSRPVKKWSGFTCDSILPTHGGELSRFLTKSATAMHTGAGICLRAHQNFNDKNKVHLQQHGSEVVKAGNGLFWIVLGNYDGTRCLQNYRAYEAVQRQAAALYHDCWGCWSSTENELSVVAADLLER